MEFLEEVKAGLRPGPGALDKVETFIKEVNASLRSAGLKAECVAGGSVAKGTFLKGDFDVDLFVRFDPSLADQDLSGLLERALARWRPERVHGSRDYFQVRAGPHLYEIIPVLAISDPALARNVTDMSPLHVEWVLRRGKGLQDDIRLAKRFCKAAGVYGAESFIRGLSGHVVDILVIHYGGFLPLLKAASGWKGQVVLDPERHYKGRMDALLALNRSKTEGPLVIIDPLLRSRNAASAVDQSRFDAFKKAAAAFLRKPSAKAFDIMTIDAAALRKRLEHAALATLATGEGKLDVVGCRVEKAAEHIRDGLQQAGFEIAAWGWHWDRKGLAYCWAWPKQARLPATAKIMGPPADLEAHVAAFRKKYPSAKLVKGKWVATLQREARGFEEHFEALARSAYVAERARLVSVESW